MKKKLYTIEHTYKGQARIEYMEAYTTTEAIKKLCDALRERGRPVKLSALRVKSFIIMDGQ